jgi:hypothetical protein
MEQVVHAVTGFGVSLVIGFLVLGWRDHNRVDVGDQLAALMSILAGIQFGVLWKLVEFVVDWVQYTDIQRSNSETMADLLWNDAGAVVGAVLATRLYCHVVTPARREELGRAASWLLNGPSRVLDRHGFLVTIVVVGAATLTVAGLWFAGRPMPGIPNG